MALSEQQLQRLREAAEREGVPAEELIAIAEEESGGAADSSSEEGESSQRPQAERLLVGFLPFIKVRELRKIWLKLDEPLEDDHLSIADWKLKHGEVSLRGGDKEDSRDAGGEPRE